MLRENEIYSLLFRSKVIPETTEFVTSETVDSLLRTEALTHKILADWEHQNLSQIDLFIWLRAAAFILSG